MSKYLFTFGFKGTARILTDKNSELDELPFVAVYSTTYQRALKKVFKLQLPHVDSEEDLMFMSCQEEVDLDEDDAVKVSET